MLIRTPDCRPREVGLAFMLGLIVPLTFIAWFAAAGIPFAHGDFETGKYSVIAYDWLNTGLIEVDPEQRQNLQRLPLYPALLALVFAIFGDEAYLPLVLVQAAMASGCGVFCALSAAHINRAWYWPAVVLASLTLNISYRASTALPDTLFLFLFAGFLWSLFAIMATRGALRAILLAGMFGALAILTRPVFQLVPVVALPLLALLLRRSLAVSWRRTMLAAMVPLGLIGTAYGAQTAKVWALTGHPAFTVQAGRHTLLFMVPCLAQTYGCGELNDATLSEAERRHAAALDALPEQDRGNPVVEDRLRQHIALEMLAEMPVGRLLLSAAASMAKMMLHTTTYEILDRVDVPTVRLSLMPGDSAAGRFVNFLEEVVSSPPMLVWLVSQLAVLAATALHLIGTVSGIADRERRWLFVMLVAMALALLAPAVGIGNPRYRTPAEPLMILLLLQGAWTLRAFVPAIRRRTAARSGDLPQRARHRTIHSSG